ncbi:MAG: clostripain-related cysteine peptidase [Candidatus Heimdallarchaeota archaeon]|nr:clostripain-related cysteine peptidase [Candidatus Heimdallarchaeota archaeon]
MMAKKTFVFVFVLLSLIVASNVNSSLFFNRQAAMSDNLRSSLPSHHHPSVALSEQGSMTQDVLETSTKDSVADVKDWTFMVYLDGDNNLEDAAIEDINEMESGGGSTDDVNVITLIDRNPGYDATNGDWTGARYYKIVNDHSLAITSQLLADLGEVDMSDPATLEAFLRYCFANFPAEHYALSIWDHGNGVFGACYDDTTGSDACLYLDEIQSAIKSASNAFGEKIDIIAFDCCLMGMIELAYELRHLCDYFIGSEDLTPWDGFNYEVLIHTLTSNSSITPKAYAPVFVNAFADDYSDVQGKCLSLIDETKLLKIIPVMQNFVGNLTEAIKQYDHAYIIMFARRQSRFFNDGVFVDFKHFLEMLVLMTELKGIEETSLQLIDLLNSIVLFNWQHESFQGTANGLSLFFPITSYGVPDGAMYDYANKTRWFVGLDWSSASHWGEFIRLCYDTYGLVPQKEPPELYLGQESSLQTMGLNYHNEFSVHIQEAGTYEFRLGIQSGDADLSLIGGGGFNYNLYGSSKLQNPAEDVNETIRLFLTKGTYYLFIQSNAPETTYTIYAGHYQPLVAKVNSVITGTGGSTKGDASGNFVQELHHYYMIAIAADEYTILLNNSATACYQVVLYMQNWTVLAAYSSNSPGESCVFSFNSSIAQTIIMEIFAVEGAGTFTIQMLGKAPAENQGPRMVVASIIISSGLLGSLLIRKRRKNH